MFSHIAPKYDFLNHLLSFNIDRSWRKLLLERLGPVLSHPEARILDLCCGTGDVLLDLEGAGQCRILGADFCHPMLLAAQEKAHARGFRPLLFEADALELPLATDSLDAIAISFGFRNLANYQAGLGELHRVLKPRGTLAILEFSHPSALAMRVGYGLYSNIVMPAVGALISGSREAYRYLPDSIRKFPNAEELLAMMRRAGFGEADFRLLTGGVAALHTGRKV